MPLIYSRCVNRSPAYWQIYIFFSQPPQPCVNRAVKIHCGLALQAAWLHRSIMPAATSSDTNHGRLLRANKANFGEARGTSKFQLSHVDCTPAHDSSSSATTSDPTDSTFHSWGPNPHRTPRRTRSTVPAMGRSRRSMKEGQSGSSRKERSRKRTGGIGECLHCQGLYSPGTLTVESPGLPSAAELSTLSSAKVAEWFRATSTSDAYKRYVKDGREWVRKWVEETQRSEGAGDESDDAGSTLEPGSRDMAEAFDMISELTPRALHAFVVYKCEVQGNSYKTAEGIRSAFKHYFT